MTITAVGFDLDYTLTVPDRDRTALLTDALEAVSAPPITREEYLEAHRRNLTGETRTPIFEELLRGVGTGGTADARNRARELTREYREAVNDALTAVSGVERMVAELRPQYHTGLLTNGPTVAQREKLEVLGWQDLFDEVVITGDLSAGKPAEAAFTALLTALGTTPDETAYVGDEVEADVGGAKAAGLVVVQVLYPDGPAADPRADEHVLRAELAEDLPTIIESL